MTELWRHIGPDTDVPAGDIGVGGREIGYLFGQYKRLSNQFTGVLTGKGLNWGGSLIRPEATGYGAVYFAAEMLATRNETLRGQDVPGLRQRQRRAVHHREAARSRREAGHRVRLGWLHLRRGGVRSREARLPHGSEERAPRANPRARGSSSRESVYTPVSADDEHNPLWMHRAQCAFPSATQNEIGAQDAANLIANGVFVVAEGANMPCTLDAVRALIEARVLYAPGKAANAGGVATSGLEMAQNSARLTWTREEVDARLRGIMCSIHRACRETAEEFGVPGNYVHGANIAGFIKVGDSMLEQGLV